MNTGPVLALLSADIEYLSAPQGSPEWIAMRAQRFGASEAAAMLGLSPYETRGALLARKATGIEPEHDEHTLRIFANGHAVEAAIRTHVEQLVGDELSPVTCTRRGAKLIASCDGLTLMRDVAWENKHWNEGLAAEVRAGRVPDTHMPQCQQVLLVTGADRLVFTVTDGTPEGTVWCEVLPDMHWFERIVLGWAQFAKDLEAYVPQEAPPVIVPAAQEHLPAVSVQVSGSLAVFSNLADLKPKLAEFIARIPKAPATDQEFADVGAAGKRLREVQQAIVERVSGALASIKDVNEIQRLGNELAEMARQAAIACEKAHDTGKEQVKTREVQQRLRAVTEHIAAAIGRTGPYFFADTVPVDFGAALRNMKTTAPNALANMRDRLDTALAQWKISFDQAEAQVAANLATIQAAGPDAQALFADRAQLVHKDPEAVAAIVAQRVAERRAAEEKRLEAERARIRAEEEARAARAAQEAKEAAERAQASMIPAPAPAAAAPHAQESGSSPGTPGMLTGNGATAAAAPPSGSEGGSAQADLSALPPVKLSDICDRLGWRMTAAEVNALGVPTHKEKVTVFVAGSDVHKLKAALLLRVQGL